jgi:hypothetical protein
MNHTDLLDDNLDWDKIWSEEDFENEKPTEPRPVRMLQTFNTEEQAQLAAATLRGSGIPAYVVSAATSGMTPFAYGNFRLFVAESHAAEAAQLLAKTPAEAAVITESNWSATVILIAMVGVLVLLSVLFYWLSNKIW